MSYLVAFQDIPRYWSKIANFSEATFIWRSHRDGSFGIRYRRMCSKTRMMWLQDREKSLVIFRHTLHKCDRQTDRHIRKTPAGGSTALSLCVARWKSAIAVVSQT